MGAVFSIFAGVYFWLHKFVGKQNQRFASQFHLELMFVGVNMTFMPMH